MIHVVSSDHNDNILLAWLMHILSETRFYGISWNEVSKSNDDQPFNQYLHQLELDFNFLNSTNTSTNCNTPNESPHDKLNSMWYAHLILSMAKTIFVAYIDIIENLVCCFFHPGLSPIFCWIVNCNFVWDPQFYDTKSSATAENPR